MFCAKKVTKLPDLTVHVVTIAFLPYIILTNGIATVSLLLTPHFLPWYVAKKRNQKIISLDLG
jgi:hypothetical protein